MNFRPSSPKRRLWDTWFYDRDGEFYLYYLSNPVREDGSGMPWDAFSLAVSRDLIHWEERGEVFTKSSNPSDWDSQIITTGDIIAYRNRYYMSYRATHQNTEKNNIIVSDDLVTWERISPDPVLVTKEPYEWDPTQTINNNVEMRDVTMTELPDGTVEGIFTARINSGPHTGRGVLATAYTRDMIHWDLGEPLFSPGIFNVIEVPSRYQYGDRSYLLFCVNNFLESNLESARYPIMRFCTGYSVSQRFDGPFSYQQDQVLGIGDAYVGRIVDAGEETLFIHHLVSKRPAFCFPKTVSFNDDGTIQLGYWRGIDALAQGDPVTDFDGIAPGTGNRFPVCTCTSANGIHTLENINGYGDACLPGVYSDFVLDVDIDLSNCEEAGIVLNADSITRRGVMLSLKARDGELHVGESKTVYGHLAPAKTDYIFRDSSVIQNVVTLKAVSRSEGFDWYVNGTHVLTTVNEDFLEGAIVLFVRRGVARFAEMTVQPLESERFENL